MSSFAKNVILPCALLVGAVLSLWKFVDWSGPERTAEDKERELAAECAEILDHKLPYEEYPSYCLELEERIRYREGLAFMEQECPKIGGRALNDKLCVRDGKDGIKEYTDGAPVRWYDCLERYVRETDEDYCPGAGCYVLPPTWCPSTRGYRDVYGVVHLD